MVVWLVAPAALLGRFSALVICGDVVSFRTSSPLNTSHLRFTIPGMANMSSDTAVDLRASRSCDGPCKVCVDLDVDCAVQLASDTEDLEIEINGVHRAAMVNTQWSKIVDAASQIC